MGPEYRNHPDKPDEQEPGDAALVALIRQEAENVVSARLEATSVPFWRRTPFLAGAMGVILFIVARLGVDNFSTSPHAANLLHDALGTELALRDTLSSQTEDFSVAVANYIDAHLSNNPQALEDMIFDAVRRRPYFAFHGRHSFGPQSTDSEERKDEYCSMTSKQGSFIAERADGKCTVTEITDFSDYFDMPFFAKFGDNVRVLIALDSAQLDFETMNTTPSKISDLENTKLKLFINGKKIIFESLRMSYQQPSASSKTPKDQQLFEATVPHEILQSARSITVSGADRRLHTLELRATTEYPQDHFTGAAVIVFVNSER